MKIIIAGYGVVGKAIKKRFFPDADIYDPFLGYSISDRHHYDCCVICVPTDLEHGKLSTKNVEDVLNTIDADYYLMKSTVPIGFCDRFENVLFSPEFSGSTPNSIGIDDDFTIVGATTKKQRQFITDLMYKYKSNMIHKVYYTTNKEAELLKFYENTYLGYVVTLATEFKKIADKYDVDYNIVSQLLRLDKRMPQSHIHVFENQDYYDSHCLNKDIPHIANDSELLKYFVDYNEKKKNKHSKK